MVSHDLHIVMKETHEVLCINRHLCCAGTPETISNDPTFIHFFGDQLSKNIAFYAHHHNHKHNIHGDVCCNSESRSTVCTHQNKENNNV